MQVVNGALDGKVVRDGIVTTLPPSQPAPRGAIAWLTRGGRSRWVVGGAIVILSAGVGLRGRHAAAPAACAGVVEPVVVVSTDAHQLALCAAGRAEHVYSVRLGKSGVGKQRTGDGKTPLGRYPLEAPRGSASFGTFVPIGYPTAAQRQLGFTGSAIGIHGPHRSIRFLGSLLNTFDTTDGCVGLATDTEMAAVAAWIRDRRPKEVVLQGK
jgi:L,D-transpeptidase catalytic domain